MDRDSFFKPFASSSRSLKSTTVILRFLGLLAVILFSGFFFFTPSFAAQGSPAWVADELLVTLRPGVARERAQNIYRRLGAAVIDEIPQIKTHLIRVPPHAMEKVREALLNQIEVESVEQNRAFAPGFTPNDTYYPKQWHHPQINSPQAWNITQGATGIIVAVLDSGVDASHPDLGGKLVAGYNFYDNNTDTSDVYGHGTKVAGAAAAAGNNGIGVAGVALEAGIMPIRVTGTDGWAYTSTISKGLIWAVDNGARIMNLSFGGITGSSTIRSAAMYVVDRGGVVVAASGNCGCDDSAPETPYIVSVAATGSRDEPAYFSSRGEYVDVSAPGLGIWTTTRGGGYGSVSGTSFSSPVTAGVVALIFSVNPQLAPLEVMEILENTSDDLGPAGYDTSFGFGRVNAYEALQAAIGSESQPDTTPPHTSIVSPASGAIVSSTISVGVQAPDDVGTILVELYLDGDLLVSDTTAPFTFIWDSTQAENGDHTLQAVAHDAAGNTGYSDVVGIIVDNSIEDITPPEVSIVFPADGSVIEGTISVNVSTSDDVGVTAVEILLDGIPLAVDNAAPFSLLWDTTRSADGMHTLQARAFDGAGNTAVSLEVTVTVQNAVPDISTPLVEITSPVDGAPVSKLVKVQVQAVDDTLLAQIDLLIDGKLNRTTTCSASFCELLVPWNTRKETAGSHTLTAVAYDGAGNEGVTEITVIVE